MQQQHDLNAHNSISVYLLAVATPYLLCSSSMCLPRPNYINIVIFIKISCHDWKYILSQATKKENKWLLLCANLKRSICKKESLWRASQLLWKLNKAHISVAGKPGFISYYFAAQALAMDLNMGHLCPRRLHWMAGWENKQSMSWPLSSTTGTVILQIQDPLVTKPSS